MSREEQLEEACDLRQSLEELATDYSGNSDNDRVITLGDVRRLLDAHPDRSK